MRSSANLTTNLTTNLTADLTSEAVVETKQMTHANGVINSADQPNQPINPRIDQYPFKPPHQLPFNLNADAQAWVTSLIDTLAKTQQTLAELSHQQSLDQLKIQALVLELAMLRRMRFGRSSEAITHSASGVEQQQSLFAEHTAIDIAAIESEIERGSNASNVSNTATATAADVKNNSSRPRKSHGRQALPEHLPRVIKRFDLSPDELACNGCGNDRVVFREDISETLDVTPAQFFVNRNIRPQYACRCCETVTAAPVPAAIIDGGVAASGLITWVLISKYADHLPLYRLESIAARQGVSLPRSNLAAWVGQYGFALRPLVERLRQRLLSRSVLHADETPIKQLNPGAGKTKHASLWAYRSAEYDGYGEDGEDGEDGEYEESDTATAVNETPNATLNAIPNATPNAPSRNPKIIVFDYQGSRAGSHASAFLSNNNTSLPTVTLTPSTSSTSSTKAWQGHLMVDDYAGYKALFRDNPQVIELGCMAHARRKFFELYKANHSVTAKAALDRIGELYAIESATKTGTVGQRKAIRINQAVPKLLDMKAWLIATRVNTANGGALAKAIDYTLRRWDALTRYAHSGHLPIDNNPVENAIRPIAIGKKNWLFVGSERSGQHAAAIQSLLGTAKLNQLDPARWLKDVLDKLPTWPNSRIDELLPFADYQFTDQ